jgi:hypothetical protein
MMLSGLRSRCTSPRRCTAPNGPTTSAATAIEGGDLPVERDQPADHPADHVGVVQTDRVDRRDRDGSRDCLAEGAHLGGRAVEAVENVTASGVKALAGGS